MNNASRERAESQFAAILKPREGPLSEQQQAALAITENTLRLKALRLAKEASERADRAR